MGFPSDIKGSMRECILKILWPKDDIVRFFSDCGCTKADIGILGHYKEMSRAAIVDKMFSYLSERPDEGLGQFRSMLSALINWSHFDPYYFDTLKKLSQAEAVRSIEHLRQLQEIRDHKIKIERQKREKREQELQSPKKTLDELKNLHISLIKGSMPAQRRGYEFERLLQELSKLSKLEVTEPFRVKGEQIDGAIKYDGEHYIIEAKWQEKEAANEPVYQFAAKVDGKMYGRGLFFSVNGFSSNVVQSLIIGKVIRTIFIDGADLMLVFEGYLSFSQMIDKKVKAAQTQGLIYIDPLTGKNKI